MSAKIYTKTGDAGKTSLIGGTKVPKSHIRIDAYGTVDELNSFMGLLADHLRAAEIESIIGTIQDRLFIIGSSLATDPEKNIKINLPELQEADISILEQEIDRMNDALPPLKYFILPGGHVTVSAAHIARAVCRRAERCVVQMQETGMIVAPLVVKYLNRLSDYLFMLARYSAHRLGVEEVKWNV